MNCANSSAQRRKRKLFLRPSLCTAKPFLLFLSFFTLLYLLIYQIPFTSSRFHPVLVVPRLYLLSSSSSSCSTTAPKSPVPDFGEVVLPLRIENRVLFPDHVLFLVTGGKINKLTKNTKKNGKVQLECVYYGTNGSRSRDFRGQFSVKHVVSVDKYDELRSAVRCPLLPLNYSADVDLRWGDKNVILGEDSNGLSSNLTTTSCSWKNVVYEAVVDGSTVVVFVKGLNLRANRKYDPSRFTCEFTDSKLSGQYNKISTKALAAAQEVVRCPLPVPQRIHSRNLDELKGTRVTIGVTGSNAHSRALMPSVAKLFSLDERKRGEGKYELCACTMVWNQALAIREWIMYHSWLGVERWFVYDNNSDDGTDEVIQEMDDASYNVTRHVWAWVKTQEAGFSHCALRAKSECKWVSFMDVDEYFYFPYSYKDRQFSYAGENALRTLVANVSSGLRTIAEIRTSCHSFGPSGLTSLPKRGVTVGYTCRLQSPERHKSIVRPDALDPTLLNVVHHFHLKEGFQSMNLPQSRTIINHYKYQVWQVFRTKFHRRVATYVADWQQRRNEGSKDRVPGLGTQAVEPPDWPRKFCEVWDMGLRDFVLANLADVSNGLLPWETQNADN